MSLSGSLEFRHFRGRYLLSVKNQALIRHQTVVGEGEPITFAGKIDEEVFGLDGPIWEQAHLETGAHRPADMKIALAQAADIDVATPIGKPQRAVEQNVVEGEAAASTRRPEPRIGELVVGKHVIRAGQL